MGSEDDNFSRNGPLAQVKSKSLCKLKDLECLSNKRINAKWSIVFNSACLKEHTHTYIYFLFIYLFINKPKGKPLTQQLTSESKNKVF